MSKRTLRYVTTRADHVAKLQLYAGRSAVARWFPPLAYVTIVGLSWLSAWLFFIRQGDQNWLYLASGLLALLITVVLPWLYRRYQDSFFASMLADDNLRGLVGPIELTVDDDRIEEVGALSTLRARWADVDSVSDEAGHLVILVAPLVAILVPHRAFETDEDRREFAELNRSRVASHRL